MQFSDRICEWKLAQAEDIPQPFQKLTQVATVFVLSSRRPSESQRNFCKKRAKNRRSIGNLAGRNHDTPKIPTHFFDRAHRLKVLPLAFFSAHGFLNPVRVTSVITTQWKSTRYHRTCTFIVSFVLLLAPAAVKSFDQLKTVHSYMLLHTCTFGLISTSFSWFTGVNVTAPPRLRPSQSSTADRVYV